MGVTEPRRETDADRDALVRRYHRRIHAVIYRMTGRHADGDDLVQETFLQVFKSLPRLPGSSNVDAWVYRIAMNVAIDFLRRRGRERRASERLAIEKSTVSTTPPSTPDVELEAAVFKALDQLPPDQRSVFVLRHFEALAHDEIAAIQEVPVETVRWRLFAARRKLETLLAPYL